MKLTISRAAVGALALCAAAAPALADDCATVNAALMQTAKTPYSETITRTVAGKQIVSHMVQTPSVKYVESNGRWVSMNITSKDLIDTMNEQMKTAKMTCHRVGAETVNGLPAAIYTVHVENQGSVSDSKLWISPQNLEVKSEMQVNGMKFSVLLDYSHVQPPANAKPLGAK